MLFVILILIFLLAFLYSVIYQIRCFIIRQKKDELGKKVNSIIVGQYVLKNNNTNIYLVKTNNNKRSHYDVKRNAIRLDDIDYDSNTFFSVANSIALAINAVSINKGNRFYFLLANYINKIAIVICIVCIYLHDLTFLMLGMIFFLGCLFFKYNNLKKEMDILNTEIDNIKKEYKINDKDIEKIYNYTSVILYNELSFNIFK